MLGNGVNLQKKKYSGVSLGWNSKNQKCFPLIRNFHLSILPEYLANLLGFKEVFQSSMLFPLSLFHLLRLCFNWVCSISERNSIKNYAKRGSASFATELARHGGEWVFISPRTSHGWTMSQCCVANLPLLEENILQWNLYLSDLLCQWCPIAEV